MIRYKLLYLWFRIFSKSSCDARGKLARFITRNVKTSVEDTLNESPWDEEWDELLEGVDDTYREKWTIKDTLIVLCLIGIFGVPIVMWFAVYFGRL